MKTKETVAIFALIMILLAGIVVTLQLSKTVNFLSIVGYESVYKVNWGHICCEEGAYEPPYIRYADDVPTYKCNAYTDECRITIEVTDPPVWNLYRILVQYEICNLDGSNCMTYEYIGRDGDIKTIYIDYGKQITFINPKYAIGWDHRAYYKYSADFRRFYIQGEENGKIYTANSCILSPELKQRVLAGGLNELSKTGINRCQNYIIDYILVETKTYSYLGREVICQARNIYEVDKITLLDGSTRKIQGDRIKEVECCPTEPNCGDDFKFKPVEKECNYDYECPNGGEPIAITGTSYIIFNCINNKCVQSSPFDVECTNNAVCVDRYNKPNMVCKNFKCEIDDVWLGHCGDGKCESVIGETATSCPEDCGKQDISKFNFSWLYLLPILATLGLAGIFGWKGKQNTGKYYWADFVIGGVIGLIIGFVLYFIFKHWLAILLIGLIGGGGLIALILLIGGVPLLLAIINMLFKRR